MHVSLISTEDLESTLTDVVVIDCTFTMPGVRPDASELFTERHIPGARFFNLDQIADTTSDLPHMLPSAAEFERAVGAMGISNETDVVVYDTPGMVSAGRGWWTFLAMGHDRVRVLDGGLKAWLAEGRPVTAQIPQSAARRFKASPRQEMVRSLAQLLANVSDRAEQVIDARSSARFNAEVPEPRAGLRAGHIPGSLNLPSDRLSDPQTGRMKSLAELEALFAAAGLESGKPIITTCGSGVTAGALFFALHLIGRNDVALYDGSWTEWGRPSETPVEP
jgi:thiosulfate/3-mercaptopyruvate sulfurtransferase